MEQVHTIRDGFDCAAAALPDGWFAAVKLMPDADETYLEELSRYEVTFREGRSEEEWREAFVSAPRTLALARMASGRITQDIIAEADRIEPPAVCGGEAPTVAWSERRGRTWRLMLWRDAAARSLVEAEQPIRSPAVVTAAGEILTACASQARGKPVARVYDGNGRLVFETRGRRPRMFAGPHGTTLLVVERAAADRVGLAAVELFDGEAVREIDLPPADDINLNAEVTCDMVSGVFYVAWESCPCWGLDERVGLSREISVWALGPEETAFDPAAGSCSGYVRIRPEAFLDGTPQNFTPVHPRVFLLDDSPAVAFRRFRFRGMKSFGWDTYLTRAEDGGWTAPVRVSPNPGPPDAAFSLVPREHEVVGFFPCCDQRPRLTFEEEAAGGSPVRPTDAARRHRVEVVSFRRDEALPRAETPLGKEAIYVVPPSRPDVAPDPPRIPETPEGRVLIWADLHAHSAYSKCMSANDGMPADVLRYQRDLLGCDVLCLTEHVEYMSAVEFAHVMDCVEREAGYTLIPLYGVEWAKRPAHHTNIFAADREVFDRLRALMLACDHLTPLYERVKTELPGGSVTAIRHMHGMRKDEFGTAGARVAETHDPAVEWAMEAMQTRGNMMLTPFSNWPLFPNSFLNQGARLGIVGGSDHSRGLGVNAYCVTGLWVKEVSGAGVFEAIRSRQTFGAANGKIALYATLDGKPMGEETTASAAVRVTAHVACANTVRRACLVRDGEPLEWTEIGARTASVELVDEAPPRGRRWYCVTVEADSNCPRAPALAHASPFFVNVT